MITSLIFTLLFTALGVWMWWRILEKAGYPGWYAVAIGVGGFILGLIPIIGGLVGLLQLVLLYALAFVRWPREGGKVPFELPGAGIAPAPYGQPGYGAPPPGYPAPPPGYPPQPYGQPPQGYAPPPQGYPPQQGYPQQPPQGYPPQAPGGYPPPPPQGYPQQPPQGYPPQSGQPAPPPPGYPPQGQPPAPPPGYPPQGQPPQPGYPPQAGQPPQPPPGYPPQAGQPPAPPPGYPPQPAPGYPPAAAPPPPAAPVDPMATVVTGRSAPPEAAPPAPVEPAPAAAPPAPEAPAGGAPGWSFATPGPGGVPFTLMAADGKQVYTITGSAGGGELVVPEASIGNPHARVHLAPGRLGLEDLGTPGGTWIDGAQLLPSHGIREITQSKKIRFGALEFSLSRVG